MRNSIPGRLIGCGSLAPAVALIFGLQAVLTVTLLAILVPPFENSDEIAHFQRVDQISRGGLIGIRIDPHHSGGTVHSGISQVDAFIGMIRFHQDRKVDRAMLRQADAVRWGGTERLDFSNTAVYPPFLYFPAVVGIWIGKSSGLSVAATLTLSRVVSGMSCVMAACAAIALAGEYALLLAVTLSLPMSLSVFAALSQDGPMLAAAALSVALLRRIRDTPVTHDHATSDLWWLSISLGLLAMGRPAYAPFAILPMLLPRFRLSRRLTATGIAIACAGVWSLCALMLATSNSSWDRGVQPRAQIERLLLHPGLIVPLAVHTMTGRQGMEGQPFFREFVGVLGWIDVVLPGWFYGIAGIALMLAILCTLVGTRPLLSSWRLGIAFLAAVMASALVFLLIYMTWSPLGFPVVDGVQGRYFLPIALLLSVCLPVCPSIWRSHAEHFARPVRVLLLCFPTVSMIVTIASTVSRYFI